MGKDKGKDKALAKRFNESCHDAPRYPCNLLFPRVDQDVLKSYLERLNKGAEDIFCAGTETAVIFRELDNEREGEGRLQDVPLAPRSC